MECKLYHNNIHLIIHSSENLVIIYVQKVMESTCWSMTHIKQISIIKVGSGPQTWEAQNKSWFACYEMQIPGPPPL